MPRIPMLNRGNVNPLGTPQQQANMSTAGIVSAAWSDIGRTISQIGGDIMDKRMNADANAFLSKSKMDADIFAAEKDTELKLKYGQDPDTYKAEYNKAMSDFFSAREKEVPNARAKQAFGNVKNDYLARTQIMADGWANKQKLVNTASMIQTKSDEARKIIVNNPNENIAMDMLNTSNEAIRAQAGTIWNDAEATEMIKKNSEAFAGSLLEGKLQAKQYGEGLKLLDDKKRHPMFEKISPEQHERYRKLFQAGITQASAENKSRFAQDLKNVKMTLIEGDDVEQEELQGLAQRAAAMGDTDALDDINNYVKANQLMKEFRMRPPEAISQFMAEFNVDDKGTFNKEGRRKVNEDFRKIAEKMYKEKMDTPAEYFVRTDNEMDRNMRMAGDIDNPQGMRSYMQTLISKKDAQGIRNPEILTANLANTYVSQIATADGERSNYVVEKIKQGYGPAAPQVFMDMMKKDKRFTAAHVVATSFSNRAEREEIFGMLKPENREALNKSYTAQFRKTQEEEVADTNEVLSNRELKEVKLALMQADPSGTNASISNGFDDIILLEYKRLRLNGVDKNAATKEAVRKIVTDNYDTATYGNSRILVAKEQLSISGLDVSTLEDYMADSLSIEHLKKLNIQTPQVVLEDDVLDGDKNQRYLEQVRRAGQWVMTPSQDGIELRIKNGTGRNLEAVRDVNGNPIVIQYDQISKVGAGQARAIAREEEFKDPRQKIMRR